MWTEKAGTSQSDPWMGKKPVLFSCLICKLESSYLGYQLQEVMQLHSSMSLHSQRTGGGKCQRQESLFLRPLPAYYDSSTSSIAYTIRRTNPQHYIIMIYNLSCTRRAFGGHSRCNYLPEWGGVQCRGKQRKDPEEKCATLSSNDSQRSSVQKNWSSVKARSGWEHSLRPDHIHFGRKPQIPRHVFYKFR